MYGPASAPLANRVPGFSAPAPPSDVPVAVSATNTITLRAINAWVTVGVPPGERIVLTRVRSRAHSGQRMPTGVGVMQSGQMGRPHDEHDTPVSREGWR